MTAYGRDIPHVMAWTMPQLRLLARYRDIRERDERKWQLMLASGTMSEEASSELWSQLEGDDDNEGKYTVVAQGGTTSSSAGGGSQRGHSVDSHGNVMSKGAPLLSDIATGKARAPQLIPIRVIDKSNKENDG